ncbi:MAG: hypothetical protein ABL931_13660 [Usitatibacteraceae bacterium]
MSRNMTFVVLVDGEPKRAGDTLVFAKEAAQSYLRPGHPVSIRCPSPTGDGRADPTLLSYDYERLVWVSVKG